MTLLKTTLLLVSLLGLMVGCSGSGEQGAAGRGDKPLLTGAVETTPPVAGGAGCPVTRPNDRPLSGLYGNGKLATPTYFPAITVTKRNIQADGWIGEKFPWRAYVVSGDLEIAGRRLDGSAEPRRAVFNPGSPAGETVDAFWAVGILFPTPGCWSVTGTVGSAQLTFVTLVVDPHGLAGAQTPSSG